VLFAVDQRLVLIGGQEVGGGGSSLICEYWLQGTTVVRHQLQPITVSRVTATYRVVRKRIDALAIGVDFDSIGKTFPDEFAGLQRDDVTFEGNTIRPIHTVDRRTTGYGCGKQADSRTTPAAVHSRQLEGTRTAMTSPLAVTSSSEETVHVSTVFFSVLSTTVARSSTGRSIGVGLT